jgi:hypothetical protein
MKKKIMKEVLSFRSEYFITAFVLTLCIVSLIYIGFDNIWNTGFNICLIISVPLSFFSIRIARRMLLKAYVGKVKENE